MCPRSALSLSLVRYTDIHCVGRGYAPFSSAQSFIASSGEGDRVCWRGGLAARPSVRPAVRVLVSPLCSLFIVHSCHSRQEAAFFIYPVSTIAPSPPRQILRPLPVAGCLFRLVPHSLRSPTLVPSCVSPPVSFSCRLVSSPRSHLILSRPMCRTLAAAPFCSARLAVLPVPRRFLRRLPHRLTTG